MTPIPTPEALYRRLRPEPERKSVVQRGTDWWIWRSDLDRLLKLAASTDTEIAASFMLLGMMPDDPAYKIEGYRDTCTVGVGDGPDVTKLTPAAALYAAMGAAIDLRRE